MKTTFTFPVHELRSWPDPNLKDVRHYSFYLKVSDTPLGMWSDVNARTQSPDKRLYSQISDSLLGQTDDTPGLFHLRNQGITILADSATYNPKFRTIELDLYDKETHGLVNGGHTYQIFCNAMEENPDERVWVHVMCGIPKHHVVEISKGLNTSLQVKTGSLIDLQGDFDWIKEILSEYSEYIAWDENDSGRLKVEDILKYMTCLNVIQYPSEDSHPMKAYSNQELVLKNYSANLDQYKSMSNVLIDICKLHDYISLSAQHIWNGHETKNGHGKFGQSKMQKPRKLTDKTIFLDKNFVKNDRCLQEAVVWPILSGFRAYMDIDENGMFAWKRSFEEILQVWDEVGYSILHKIWKAAEAAASVTVVPRDSSVWDFTFMKLQNKESTEK
jgi:hypothetical protein